MDPADDRNGAVAADDVSRRYGDHVALSGVTFRLPRGGTTAVIGPNGSGKTTLLRLMSRLEHPTSGTVTVVGSDGGRGSVAHVLQAQAINASVPLTVLETVRMGRYAARGLLGRLRADDHDAVVEAIDRMQVGDLVDRHLHELSTGQRQRVFVAQGLAQQADLLLLDEPAAGLDVTSRDRIDAAVDAEVAAGRTVVMTTHDVATAARADHVLLLATHLVASGTAAEVLSEPHLAHAYGPTAFRTSDGTLIIGDPHVHGTHLEGHEHH